MPHGYSVREAVNEGEVHTALCAATKGYGGVVRFARRVGFTHEYVQGMLYGGQRMSAKVARALGYELRWVRVEQAQAGRAKQPLCEGNRNAPEKATWPAKPGQIPARDRAASQ
jgi:hypothetical protein